MDETWMAEEYERQQALWEQEMFDERFEDWMTEGSYRDWALKHPSHTVAQLKAAFLDDMLDDAISAAEAQAEW